MPSEEYKRVEPISGSEPKKVQLQPSAASEEEALSKAKFEEAMSRADTSKVERREIAAAQEPVIAEVKKPSLMEAATKVKVEPEKVTAVPKQLADQAADLRRQLQRPRAVLLEIDARPHVPVENPNPGDVSAISSMGAHLEHMDRELRDVTQLTTGVEIGSLMPAEKGKSPAVRFLSFLTESDRKLGNFVDEMKGLQIGQQRLSPEQLFAIQIKLGFVQTELEFFTGTLNKALESVKTLMNVQI